MVSNLYSAEKLYDEQNKLLTEYLQTCTDFPESLVQKLLETVPPEMQLSPLKYVDADSKPTRMDDIANGYCMHENT